MFVRKNSRYKITSAISFKGSVHTWMTIFFIYLMYMGKYNKNLYSIKINFGSVINEILIIIIIPEVFYLFYKISGEN